MWKKVWREYFAFPKKERRALWVLFIIWMVLLSYQIYQANFWEIDRSQFAYKIVLVDELQKSDERKYQSTINSSQAYLKKKRTIYFNYIEKSDLREAGISEKAADHIMHLKRNGLKIYTLSSLKNASSIDTFSKKILSTLLKFYPEKKYFKPIDFNTPESVHISVNINSVDTAALDKLKGISYGTARRVLRYRERLGGYIQKEQLKEFWGMDSLSYSILVNSIFIEKNQQKRININSGDLKTLGAHPYIGYALAKLIVNYRSQHGNYKHPNDLFQIHVMNEEIFSKIEAYITVDE